MADQKLTALTELTAAISTDILYIVDDPGGSPLSKKITVANLKAAVGVLSYSTATVTTGNVTAVEGQFDDLTISGLTADRDWNLPTPSAAGVFCAVRSLTDAPTAYALVIKANSAELTRLYYANESLVFRSTGTGAADWEVAEGGYGVNEVYLPIGSYVTFGLVAGQAFPFSSTIKDNHRILSVDIAVYLPGASHDVTDHYTIDLKLRADGTAVASDVTLASGDTQGATTLEGTLINLPITVELIDDGFIFIQLEKVNAGSDFFVNAPMVKVRKRP